MRETHSGLIVCMLKQNEVSKLTVLPEFDPSIVIHADLTDIPDNEFIEAYYQGEKVFIAYFSLLIDIKGSTLIFSVIFGETVRGSVSIDYS